MCCIFVISSDILYPINANLKKIRYVFDDVTGAAMSDVSSESETGNVSLDNQVMGSATVGQREGQNETLTTEELRKRRQAYYDR